LYSDAIALAFGDPPDLGVMKLAKASGASSSEAAPMTATATAAVTRTRRVTLGRTAAAFYPAGGVSITTRHGRWASRQSAVGPSARSEGGARPDAGH